MEDHYVGDVGTTTTTTMIAKDFLLVPEERHTRNESMPPAERNKIDSP